MLRQGISVKDGFAWCGKIKQSDSAIARAANVDRRVVRSTIESICSDEYMSSLFSKFNSMLLLADAASLIGCSAIEIVPVDASVPGVMAGILNVLYEARINVRQAVVSDPESDRFSHLIITVDGTIPGDVMTKVRNCRSVSSVIIK